MKILTIPHLTLRQKSQEVTHLDRHLKRLLTDLQITLLHSEIGVGLAAPQIGSNYRVFAVNLPDSKHPETHHYHYFINPTITACSSETSQLNAQGKPELEGCLSVPRLYAPVKRPIWIDVTYQTLQDGQLQTHQAHFDQADARVFQHEYDHLDGILFLDHAFAQNQPIYQEQPNGELERVDPDALRRRLGNF